MASLPEQDPHTDNTNDDPSARFGRGWVPLSRDIGIPHEDHAVVSREPRHDGWDAGRKVRFLHHLSDKGDVRAACARVGMSRASAYVLRRRDLAFAQGWQAALVLARRHVEEVLATRAIDGVEEAIWFRGELVGTRRRFDARLLLAHLARLDALAGEAEDMAARFDEALAMIAGERAAAAADGADPALDGLDDDPSQSAYIAASDAWIDAVEAIDAAFAEEEGALAQAGASGAEGDASAYPQPPSLRLMRQRWRSRALARVDAELAGEMEFKGLCAEALDRVNRVNFTARRSGGTGGQNLCPGGNALAGSLLSSVKAGAALPPPPPSCAGRPSLQKNRSALADQLSRTASSTRPDPAPTMPISSAAASDRSITRLP